MGELNFAIGSESGPQSSIWKVWTHGGQVYAAPRATGAILKISLHTPDYWAAALTDESGAVFPWSGNRVGRIWKRPAEFMPGWTQGPMIGVIRTHETHIPPVPHPTRPTPKAGVIWVRPPAVGHKVAITMLFQSDPAAPPPLPPGAEMIGSLPLETGETLWLAANWLPASDFEMESHRTFRDNMQITPGSPDGTIDALSMISIGENAAGPQIVEMFIGEENIVSPSVSKKPPGRD